MPDYLSCPACGSRVSDDRRGGDRLARCEKCGAVVLPEPADWNPYQAPSSPLSGGVEGIGGPLEIPSSVLGKFALAIRLLASNLGLFSLIILTVWLPANVAIAFFAFYAPEDRQEILSIQLTNLIQGVFGPISIGALIHAVSKRLHGEKVGYRQAIGAGFGNWGPLFVANLMAGIFILLGVLALIIPGIILMLRYALLDPVVVLERATAPRERSTTLTSGRRWQILGAGLLFFTLFLGGSLCVQYAVALVQEEVDWLANPWVNAATDCLIDVASTVMMILMVLFYQEARQQELMKPAKARTTAR